MLELFLHQEQLESIVSLLRSRTQLTPTELQILRISGSNHPNPLFKQLARGLFVAYSAHKKPIMTWWHANQMDEWFNTHSLIIPIWYGSSGPLSKRPKGLPTLQLRLTPETQGWAALSLDAQNTTDIVKLATIAIQVQAALKLSNPIENAMAPTDVIVDDVGSLSIFKHNETQDCIHWGANGLVCRYDGGPYALHRRSGVSRGAVS